MITVNLRYTGTGGNSHAFAEEMMSSIASLREKCDLHMTVERFVSIDDNPDDERFIRE